MLAKKTYLRDFNYEKILNYLILLYAFCLPISRAGTSFASIMLILLWFLEKDYRNKFNQIKNNYLIIIIVIFVVYSLIAVLWSSDKIFALTYVKKYWHFLMIPIIFTSLKEEYINKVFSAFLFGMLISEITSYGIFFEIFTKEGVLSSDPSPFMDHSNYSTYLAITVFILLHKIIYADDLRWRLAYGIFFLFSTSNLFLNGGRTGQFSFLIALLIIGFLNFKNKIISTFAVLFLGGTIFIAAYNFSPVFKHRFDYFIHDIEQMIYKKDYSNSFSLRVALWKTGLEASKSDIIFGTGIGDERLNAQVGIEKYKFKDRFSSKDTKEYIDFHNAFIQYLVQLGVVGLVFFLLIFYFLARIKIKDKIYRNLLVLFIIIYFLHSSLGLSFHINQSMVLFVLFTSLFLTTSKFEKNKFIN